MTKPNFAEINAGRAKAIEDTIAQATQTAQETQKTPPRRGRRPEKESQDVTRINLAIDPDVYDYIKVMSGIFGVSSTNYIGQILREHMEKNADKYRATLEFRKSL